MPLLPPPLQALLQQQHSQIQASAVEVAHFENASQQSLMSEHYQQLTNSFHASLPDLYSACTFWLGTCAELHTDLSAAALRCATPWWGVYLVSEDCQALGTELRALLAGAGIGGAARRPNQASAHAKGSSTTASPDLTRPSLASQAPGDLLAAPHILQ